MQRRAVRTAPTRGAGLLIDKSGNLYGSTSAGGALLHGGGTVFELTPSGNEMVLYNFCSAAFCTDGIRPLAELVADRLGNRYGTTAEGGIINKFSRGFGTIFKVAAEGGETVLHRFCSAAACIDGANPGGRLTTDGLGRLYGTTGGGGANGGGTVFEVSSGGKERVVYSFCAAAHCADGDNPLSGLTMDARGNVYGTTDLGGANGLGTVFEVTRGGEERVLYSFCSAANCSDGAYPEAGLFRAVQENLSANADCRRGIKSLGSDVWLPWELKGRE